MEFSTEQKLRTLRNMFLVEFKKSGLMDRARVQDEKYRILPGSVPSVTLVLWNGLDICEVNLMLNEKFQYSLLKYKNNKLAHDVAKQAFVETKKAIRYLSSVEVAA